MPANPAPLRHAPARQTVRPRPAPAAATLLAGLLAACGGGGGGGADSGGGPPIQFNLELMGPGIYQGETGGVRPTVWVDIRSRDGIGFDSLLVDFGDGSAPSELVRPGTDFPSVEDEVTHAYASRGSYDTTWTAVLRGGTTQTHTLKVNLPQRLTASVGQFAYNGGWSESSQTRQLVDVNGDGKADIIGFGVDGVWVSLSTGQGFAPAYQATREFAQGQATTAYRKEAWPMRLGDFNRDGRPDIVLFAGAEVAPLVTNYNGAGAYVALNDGNGRFAPASRWTADFNADDYPGASSYPRLIADFNGDGRDDIVGFGRSGFRIGLSDGQSFTSPSGSDVLITALGSDSSAGEWTDQHPREVGDFNGDGYADIIGFGERETEVWLNCAGSGPGTSTGCTGAPSSSLRFTRQVYSDWFSRSASWGVSRTPRHIVDIDGDGDDDVVGFYLGGVQAAVAVGGRLQGNDNGDLLDLVPQFGDFQGWRTGNDPRALVDVTGDGLVDVVGVGPINGPNTDGGVVYALNQTRKVQRLFFEQPDFVSSGLWLRDFSAFRPVPNTNPSLFWNETDFPRRFADVDGDGRADLVVFGLHSVTVEFATSTQP